MQTYITVINTCNLHPDSKKLEGWEVKKNIVYRECDAETNEEAALTAMRLVSKLGALGCVVNHKTNLKSFVLGN